MRQRITCELGDPPQQRRAFRKYGKGRHAAALNFDCVSYATAKHLALPLLFKGEDFRQTDIESATS